MNTSGEYPLSTMLVHTSTITNNNDDINNMAVEEQGIPHHPSIQVSLYHSPAPVNNNPAIPPTNTKNTTDIEYVELRKEDILCGRGSGPNEG